MKQHNRVYAEIDLDAIAYNMEQMRNRIGGDAELIAVVKTDGYGHGAVPIAEMFEKFSYVWGYAVACLEEAEDGIEEGTDHENDEEEIARQGVEQEADKKDSRVAVP